MTEEDEYKYKAIMVKEKDKEKVNELKSRYEDVKSPFLEITKMDFVEKVLNLGFEELDISIWDFKKALDEEEESGG